jgi:hypothetical protein
MAAVILDFGTIVPAVANDNDKLSSTSLSFWVVLLCFLVASSDVPGPAWAQASGLGWALEGSGLLKLKPDPELRAGPGLGLVGLEPGLTSQKSN